MAKLFNKELSEKVSKYPCLYKKSDGGHKERDRKLNAEGTSPGTRAVFFCDFYFSFPFLVIMKLIKTKYRVLLLSKSMFEMISAITLVPRKI